MKRDFARDSASQVSISRYLFCFVIIYLLFILIIIDILLYMYLFGWPVRKIDCVTHFFAICLYKRHHQSHSRRFLMEYSLKMHRKRLIMMHYQVLSSNISLQLHALVESFFLHLYLSNQHWILIHYSENICICIYRLIYMKIRVHLHRFIYICRYKYMYI
jgi:hypothetical protein